VLVQLEDQDFKAQVAQATAAVEAAKAAIENNRRQRELQDSKIQRAVAGIDQANAQIAAAQAGKEAAEADVTRTRAERTRQEALLKSELRDSAKIRGQQLPTSNVSRRKPPVVRRIWCRRGRCCAAMNWQSKPSGAASPFSNLKNCSCLLTFMPSKPD